MPVNLQWKPNNQPVISDTPERLGLELGGDDDSLGANAPGRVRLVEVPDTSTNKGENENQQPRLIATFHGAFFRDISAPAASRITFDIFIKTAVNPKNHDGQVEGFDPECMFGVDAFIFTFVNRRFVVWLPFQVDSRSEGKFLDLQVIAEAEAGAGSFRELGRSNVLSLGIRRKHRVASTSKDQTTGQSVVYTAKLVGNVVTHPEEYLLLVQSQTSPTQVVATPALISLPVSGPGAVPFQPYAANSLFIMLAANLLDALTPPAAKLTSRIQAALANPEATVAKAKASMKRKIAATVVEMFIDAGFMGARAPWQDEAAASVFNAAFTAVFVRRQGVWKLGNPQGAFATSYWNFVVGDDSSINEAGLGEEYQFDMNTKRSVGGVSAFLALPIPIGGGNKPLRETIRLNGARLQDVLLNFSGSARSFKDEAEFLTAVDRHAAHVGIIVAHEVGHALGLMHTPHVESGDYSEANGSPVLAVMSEGVDSGGFGTGMKFATQTKVMWASTFGVTPNFVDNTLQNKTWQPSEVKTLAWQDRKNRFNALHGEKGMRAPLFASFPLNVPPFAVAWPKAQKGTKI
jgi:hypothetical protein